MWKAKIAHDRPKPCPEDTVLRVVGTMSGTSCDGLDVALIEIEADGLGVRWLALKEFPYSGPWAARLKGMGTLPDEAVLDLEQDWTRWLADRLEPLLARWTSEFGPIHLLGLSGHTWYHEPGGRGTRAIGDASVLHRRLGLPVVADYRSADVARGGQGAPLVPLFDAHVFQSHIACLNLGGIANVTWQSPGSPVRASDLCGCNLLLNRQAERMGWTHDRDGAGAAAGAVDGTSLAQLRDWPYLRRPWPKSLAAEDLTLLHGVLDGIARPQDALATAVQWMAEAIADGIPKGEGRVLVTGGGAHHPGLRSALVDALGARGLRAEIPAVRWVDGKEAAAFAWLAWRTAKGQTTSLSSVTGATEDVCGGVLYGNFTPPGMNGL